MLAGGAEEEAGVDLGACSAAKDILSGSMRWMVAIGAWRRVESTGEELAEESREEKS